MNYYRFWFNFRFKVIKKITNLPLYTGIHWSAFFRNEIRKVSEATASDLELNVIPDMTQKEYDKDEIISVNIATNSAGNKAIISWLETTNESVSNSGSHFSLNETIELQQWNSFEFQPQLDYQFDTDELIELTLVFQAPLRLKRKDKTNGKFFDPFHFEFIEFIEKLSHSLEIPVPELSGIKMSNYSFIWLDIEYKKTIGGIVGGLTLRGNFSQELLQILHWGQFYGLGKNRTFGFGFYYLAEFPNPIYKLNESEADLFSFSYLRSKLIELVEINDSGSDMSAQELLEHPYYLRKLNTLIDRMDYEPGNPSLYRVKKKSGSFRTIASYSMRDKLLLSIITNLIDSRLQRLLTYSCFAYRKGYSYHLAATAIKSEFERGFNWGVKIDLSSFFDSISIANVVLLLKAQAIDDAIIALIEKYFSHSLIQGNTLSPLLSNFAMLPFDRWFRNHKGVKLIRYADDMVILGKTEDKERIMSQVRHMLDILGLTINADKYEEFTQASVLKFLGYHISESAIFIPQKVNDEERDWLEFPRLSDRDSKPLYLSFSIRYAHTTGNYVFVESADTTTKFAWKEISRILVLGKPRISGGIIYRAIREQIPIYFLSVHGRPLGGYQIHRKVSNLVDIFNEDEFYSFEKFQLDFIKEIAYTKIISQYRLLKKSAITEQKLATMAKEIESCDSAESIRGKEGFAAKLYFKHFRELAKPLPFESRSYHPPDGPVNVLLSLGYTLLYRRFSESLLANGINSFDGIFHQGRGTHEALASDLMECNRFIVDRIVLSLIHKKQITEDNFYHIPDSTYLKLDSLGFRTFIRAFEATMKREIRIKNQQFTYEVWIEKLVRSFKNSLTLGVSFKAHRLI